MRSKFSILYAAALLAQVTAFAQTQLAGNIHIANGATMSTTGDVYSDTDVLGNGFLLLNGSSLQTIDFTGHVLPALDLDNPAHLELASNLQIGTALVFTAGKIMIGNNELVLGPAANHFGADTAKYIVTDGAGVVTRQDLGAQAFIFPVGSSVNSDYTPAEITNQIAPRDISVLVKDYATSASAEGNVAKGIDRSWQIQATAVGNAVIALTHNAATEGAQFDRNAAFVTQQQSAWNLGTPGSGTNNGFTHAATFSIPVGPSSQAWFSKSSDANTSLPVNTVGQDETSVSVFPNPSAGPAWISMTTSVGGNIPWQLTEATGKLVRAGSFGAKTGTTLHPLPLEGLASGTYYLFLDQQGQEVPLKIVRY